RPSQARSSPSTSSTQQPVDDAAEKAEDGYTWSQQGEEVQITFRLDKPATKKDVKVNFKPTGLTVAVGDSTLLDGTLGGKVDTDDCAWCLASAGSELQVCVFKRKCTGAICQAQSRCQSTYRGCRRRITGRSLRVWRVVRSMKKRDAALMLIIFAGSV
ncbi:unnamed protein product, partial [Prorocentrum cordatum]